MHKILSSTFHPLPKYINDFLKADFNISKYLSVALFLAFAIAFNYWVNFEASYVAKIYDSTRLFRFIGFYGFAYFMGIIIIRITSKRQKYLTTPKFWVLSLVGVLLVSSNSTHKNLFYVAEELIGINQSSYLFVGRLLSEGRYFITILLPLFILWLIIRGKGDSFFGLTSKNIIYKPYVFMLLLMLPLIIIAAQFPSFLSTYPTFHSYGTEETWGISIGWLIAVYEFLYASAFLSVELFFRGFLVIGLAKVMGKDVIIPMVCLYAFLHFEKPMGEAISSIFGGYLLGIFAYYSKNIWGGVFVHMGVALLMETVAGIVKL